MLVNTRGYTHVHPLNSTIWSFHSNLGWGLWAATTGSSSRGRGKVFRDVQPLDNSRLTVSLGWVAWLWSCIMIYHVHLCESINGGCMRLWYLVVLPWYCHGIAMGMLERSRRPVSLNRSARIGFWAQRKAKDTRRAVGMRPVLARSTEWSWHVFYPLVIKHSCGKSPSLMGKSTVSMVIFNSYVKLPEGIMEVENVWMSKPPEILKQV